MDRWVGKTALVTGASSGIGSSITEELAKAGMNVLALARRLERLQENIKKLSGAKGQIFPVKCDITNEADILAAFKYADDHLGGVHVLINNAGIIRPGNLLDGKTEDWRDILNTNVLGLCICTREAVKSMRAHGVDDGHIVNINSVVGHVVHNVPDVWTPDVYAASKFGVTALTDAARHQLRDAKTKIKVTSISPGYVQTEIIQASGIQFDPTELALADIPALQPIDISNAILYTLGTPPHVQVHEVTIQPLGQAL